MKHDYTEEMKAQSFEEFIKTMINDALDDSIGMRFYPEDLADRLTEADSLEGGLFIYDEDNLAFIQQHIDIAAETAVYYKELGYEVNAMTEPAEFTAQMETYGFHKYLQQSEYLNDHLSQQMILTPDVSMKIKEDLGIDYTVDQEVMKQEALQRMQYLGLHQSAMDAFQRGEVWQSTDYGALFELTDDQKEAVKTFEAEYGGKVYHIIHGTYDFAGDRMTMDSMLYVSDYPEEWQYDRDLLKEGRPYAYVHNETIPEFSELGGIGICPSFGGLVRNDVGYDFDGFHRSYEVTYD